jgi:hypothetical protein
MQIQRYENADACIEDFNLEAAKISCELMNAERVASQAQQSWELSVASASSQQLTVDLEIIALNSKAALCCRSENSLLNKTTSLVHPGV